MRLGMLGVAALVVVAACGGAANPASSSTTDPVKGTLSVFAAASLTASFNSEKTAFRKLHPNADVMNNFAGSPTLVTQIEQGAPADLFASADQPNMQKIVDGRLNSGTPQIFTKNKLQIVVAAGNPKKIAGLADLAKPGIVLVLAGPSVPAGNYGKQALRKAGVKATPKSLETDVKSVVSKVSLGEADAGIVYVTDVKAGGATVQGVDIPADQNVVASYPVVALKNAKNPVAARAFIAFVLSQQGQKILTGAGFAPLT